MFQTIIFILLYKGKDNWLGRKWDHTRRSCTKIDGQQHSLRVQGNFGEEPRMLGWTSASFKVLFILFFFTQPAATAASCLFPSTPTSAPSRQWHEVAEWNSKILSFIYRRRFQDWYQLEIVVNVSYLLEHSFLKRFLFFWDWSISFKSLQQREK